VRCRARATPRRCGRAIVAPVVIAALATGCTTTLSPDLMVPNPPVAAAHRTERTMTVAPVTSEGKENTGVVALEDQFRVGTEEFRAALVRALAEAGIFRSVVSAGAGDYELEAHIISQQSLRTGFLTVSSSLVVNYRVREPSTDQDVWHETIITEDTEEGAPFTEGVPGAAKKSLAGAARQNVGEMVDKMSAKVR
jgi:hypothetical protein